MCVYTSVKFDLCSAFASEWPIIDGGRISVAYSTPREKHVICVGERTELLL